MNLLGTLKSLFGGSSGPVRVDLAKRFDIRSPTAGKGTMSKTFHAYDRSVGHVVCLKLLDRTETDNFEARFKGLNKPSEGQIAVALKHPNVVRTFDHGICTTGEAFLTMELLDGVGFDALLHPRSARLETDGVDYLLQLCAAVEYVHAQGFLHRDLCPRNAIVTTDDTVKLIDFGLAIPYRPEFLKGGNRTGVADYQAPELLLRGTTDRRVDVFALGMIAYEVLTGGVPWERKGNTLQKSRLRLNTPPRNPCDLRPELSAEMAEVLLTAIAREPGERYATATALREALAQANGIVLDD